MNTDDFMVMGFPDNTPTLRDQFAMSALQGLLVNNWRSEMSDEMFTQQHTAWLTQCWRHGNETVGIDYYNGDITRRGGGIL